MRGKPGLLVADDDLDIREVMAEILAGEGYQPTVVGSAEAAQEALDARIFRGVITDSFGGQSLEEVEAIVQRARPTPVGLVSGFAVSPEQAGAKGLSFALRKPFDVSQLLVEIAGMLGAPLDPSQGGPALVAKRYFEALDRKDWDALLALCAEGVKFSGPQGSRFSAALQGREALRAHSQQTFSVFRDAAFREVTLYATPGGIAARYLGTWTRDGAPMQQAGSLLLQIGGGLIRRIGVEMNQALLDRIAPP